MGKTAVFPQLVKKTCMDFLTALLPPSILPQAKCYSLKSLKTKLFRRRSIQLEAGLAPSSSPASLSSILYAAFLTVSGKTEYGDPCA